MDDEPSLLTAVAADSSFPPLPVELVHCVMEIAANEDNPTALALAPVCRAVQHWVTPIIYHTIVLENKNQAIHFYTTLRSRRLEVAGMIRALFFLPDGNWHIISELICACENLRTLVINVPWSFAKFTETVSLPQSLPSHIMLLASDSVTELRPMCRPYLGDVTHLYIDFAEKSPQLVEAIPSLPRLAYLGIGCWGNVELEELLPHITQLLLMPSLVMFLLQTFDEGVPAYELVGDVWIELAQVQDKRLLVGRGLLPVNQIALVKLGGTIWDDAEERYRDWRKIVNKWGH